MRPVRVNCCDSRTRACTAAADRAAQNGRPACHAAGTRVRHTAANSCRKDRTGADEDALRYPRTLCAFYPVGGLNADNSTAPTAAPGPKRICLSRSGMSALPQNADKAWGKAEGGDSVGRRHAGEKPRCVVSARHFCASSGSDCEAKRLAKMAAIRLLIHFIDVAFWAAGTAG